MHANHSAGTIYPHALVRRALNVAGLLTAPFGGWCGIWRYRVEFVERDGTVLERIQVRSADEATEVAAFLNEHEKVD